MGPETAEKTNIIPFPAGKSVSIDVGSLRTKEEVEKSVKEAEELRDSRKIAEDFLDSLNLSDGEKLLVQNFIEEGFASIKSPETPDVWNTGEILKLSVSPEAKTAIFVSRDLIHNLREKKLREAALIDGLTGLYSRRAFEAEIKKEVKKITDNRTKESLSLLMIDIDEFKKLNDRWGHQYGDDILKIVAEVLGKSLRADSAFRYGGEEFAVLLTNCNIEFAKKVGERIRRNIAETIKDIDENPVTVSVGCYQFQPGDDAKKLVGKADQALYKAKEKRNTVVVYE